MRHCHYDDKTWVWYIFCRSSYVSNVLVSFYCSLTLCMASSAASVFSTTTRGGCSFEELCNGSLQGYAGDNLIDITITRDGRVPTIREAEQMLLEHLDNCVRSIETERDCQLEYFYIGKTHVRRMRNRTFNHMDRNTWKLDGGINSRCKTHKEGDYGRDGLVVLTVVTREAIHPDVRRNKPDFHQEDYALALEGRLIQDCMTDSRLYNRTLEPGGRDKTPSIGYPLYMAFKVYHMKL